MDFFINYNVRVHSGLQKDRILLGNPESFVDVFLFVYLFDFFNEDVLSKNEKQCRKK